MNTKKQEILKKFDKRFLLEDMPQESLGNNYPQVREFFSSVLDEYVYWIEDEIQDDFTYFFRECHNCGFAKNNYIHCLHDGVQSTCTNCKEKLPSIRVNCHCDYTITLKEIQSRFKEIRN